MKKFWRNVLRLATLATVIPVSVTHDESTGKTTYQSLLASLEIGPGQDGITREVGLDLGEGVLTGAVRQMVAAKKESALYADSELVPSPVKTDGEEAPSEGSPAPKPCHLPDPITDLSAIDSYDPYDDDEY